MTDRLPRLIATSVVRGSQQGESHGGVFVVDFDQQSGEQVIDWNDGDIDWEGRGADRGLRGIEFDGDDIYIAASDELFVYDKSFRRLRSFKSRYLKHCHEICRQDRRLFLSSTGFDSLLSFNLDAREFDWGFQLQKQNDQWTGFRFDPRGDSGPRAVNDFHINMVHADQRGIFLSGLRTGALLHLDSQWQVNEVCNLPAGTHNAQPWQDSVMFNDTANDCVRVVNRSGTEKAFAVPRYDDTDVINHGIDDSRVARQAFGRGLCAINDRLIAAGSSPSTISIYDTHGNERVGSVNLSMDIRNAVHGLAVWPF